MNPNSELFVRKRKKLGLSQLDVAYVADVSRRTVQNVESGKEGMKTQSLHAIAGALGIKQDDIFQNTESDQLVVNRDSFSYWPWRLFEFLGRGMLPGEVSFCRTQSDAETVIAEMWTNWRPIFVPRSPSDNSFPDENTLQRNREEFFERYLRLWRKNPLTLICSVANGKRSGASVVLPVSDKVYESFLLGKLDFRDITDKDIVNSDSQNLIFDYLFEFESPSQTKRHRLTGSLGFVAFYQVAALSQNSAAKNFRLATVGAVPESIERLQRVGMMECNVLTPGYGHPIWELSASDRSTVSDDGNVDSFQRSGTLEHYLQLAKWPMRKSKVTMVLRMLRAYQKLIEPGVSRAA